MAPPPASSFARRGRKRKQVAHYTDDNPSTFTTKKKAGMNDSPEKQKSSSPPAVTTTPPSSRRKKRPILKESAVPVNGNNSSSTIVIHEHVMRTHPILPVSLLPASPNNDSGDVIFGARLGPPRSLPKPEWQLVNTPHIQSVDEMAKKKKSLPPRITCFSVCKNYLVLGDAVGQILVYTMRPLVLHMATISTTASARPSPKFKKQNEVNAVRCIDMSGKYIVICTATEMEVYHAVSQKRVWTCNLEDGVCVTKVNVHPTTRNVLASVVSSREEVSPCWIVSQNDDSDQVKVTTNMLDGSNIAKCAAMWDRSNPNRFVVVTTPKDDDEAPELLLQNFGNDDEHSTILHGAKLPPTRARNAMESISQSRHGKYTIVASSKGVRLYNTNTLELIHVYGEGLNLHGHALIYQQGLIVSELSEEDYEHNGAGVFIMGIPHAHREPREVSDELHVWQWWDTLHPSTTIKGPPRSLGFTQIWSVSPSRILALTHAGDVWMLSPTSTTDWPGVMYPPGYHVIDDNLVYIEDEDELDQIVDTPEDEMGQHETLDDELAEALRISMLEATSPAVKEEETVIIADFNKNEKQIVIPCHPDPALKEAIQQNAGPGSPVRTGASGNEPANFLRQVLRVIPTKPKAAIQEPRVKVLEATTITGADKKPIRGKRSRAGNLEAMIRASINPALQKYMTSKEQWTTEKGSTLRDLDKVPANKTIPTQQLAKNEVVAMENYAPVEMGTIEQTQGNVAQSHLYVSTNEESMNGVEVVTSAGNNGVGENSEDVAKKAISEVVASRPMDDAATFALEGLLGLQRSFSEDLSPKKSAPPVPEFDSKPAAVVTESNVVVTTSAISSDGANDVHMTDASTTQAMEIDKPVATSNGEGGDQSEIQPPKPAASSVPAESGVTTTKSNGTAGTEGPTEPEKHVVSHSEGSSPLDTGTGTSAPPAEEAMNDAGANDESQSQAVEAFVPPPDFCSACRGRMVIHTCGKREVPVDVEAIERAEKEKLEREAEEKKKLRAEKRREADARRREAKKKKKLEEARQKRIEEERLKREQEEMERARKQAEARLTAGDHQERDRRRAGMLQRLMAENGGSRQEDQNGQVGAVTTQSTYNSAPVEQRTPSEPSQVQPSYSPTMGMQQTSDRYLQQQQQQPPYYRQSYEQPSVSQGLYRTQQEQDPRDQTGVQHFNDPVPSQALNNHAPALQQVAAQPASFSTSTSSQAIHGSSPPTYGSASSTLQTAVNQQETTVVQQQYPMEYQQRQPTPTFEQNVAASQTQTTQQQRSSPFEYSQTSSGYQEQERPRPGVLERRTSAQLGTAEALASLASMCVQMPRAPTPQPSPHGSEVNHGSPFNTSSVGESSGQARSLASGYGETSTTNNVDVSHSSIANDHGTTAIQETNGDNKYAEATASVPNAPVKVTPFASSPPVVSNSTQLNGEGNDAMEYVVVAPAAPVTNEVGFGECAQQVHPATVEETLPASVPVDNGNSQAQQEQ